MVVRGLVRRVVRAVGSVGSPRSGGQFFQLSPQIMLLFVYTTTHKDLVIFTCRYFKLS